MRENAYPLLSIILINQNNLPIIILMYYGKIFDTRILCNIILVTRPYSTLNDIIRV